MIPQVYAIANEAAAKHAETRRECRKHRTRVEVEATVNLASTDHTPRITGVNDAADVYFPAEIETKDDAADYYVILHAPNAMALEFGHAPSGFFDPDKPGMPLTKPPAATYILTRAAHGGSTIG